MKIGMENLRTIGMWGAAVVTVVIWIFTGFTEAVYFASGVLLMKHLYSVEDLLEPVLEKKVAEFYIGNRIEDRGAEVGSYYLDIRTHTFYKMTETGWVLTKQPVLRVDES